MIIPAILQTELNEIIKEVNDVENVAKLIHIDIADGMFVEGKTYLDIEKIDAIDSPAKFELHLMTKNPQDFLPKKPKKITNVIVHVESENIEECINKAKGMGLSVGLCLSPKTPITTLEAFLINTNTQTKVDYIQFMTVEPGQQGKPFVPEVLIKIEEFKQKYPNIVVQVDGHINKQNIVEISKLGVDHYVVGSAIFSNACPTCEEIELERLID